MGRYLEELFSLQGSAALISGGYGHLGKSMTWALAAAGARTYVAGPNRAHFERAFPPSRLADLEREGLSGGEILYLPLDLRFPERFASSLQGLEQSGGLDILVNNAFYLSPADRPDFSLDMMGVLGSAAALSEACLDLLKKSGRGCIVNIASMYGFLAPSPEMYAEHPQQRSRFSYNAAKGALLQASRYWASFWGPFGIRVNSISPGAFPRPEVAAEESFSRKLAEKSLLGRSGEPRELEGALLLLCSEAGSFITGTNLVVDGGWSTT